MRRSSGFIRKYRISLFSVRSNATSCSSNVNKLRFIVTSTRSINSKSGNFVVANFNCCFCLSRFLNNNRRGIISTIPTTKTSNVDIGNPTIKDRCYCSCSSTTISSIINNINRRNINISRTASQQFNTNNSTSAVNINF